MTGIWLMGLIGVTAIVAATAAWLGKWRSWASDAWLGSYPVLLGFPGAGFVIISAAALTATGGLIYVGLGFIAAGLVLMAWRPIWSYPPWYRDRKHRQRPRA